MCQLRDVSKVSNNEEREEGECYVEIVDPFETLEVLEPEETDLEVLIDYNSQAHIQYLSKRKLGLNNIYLLKKMLCFTNTVKYRAIRYLDELYLKHNFDLSVIDEVSTICVLLSLQFNGCDKTEMGNLFQITKEIKNFNELEILVIKSLDYNLNMNSFHDFLINIMLMSKDFSLYSKCLELIDKFITDPRALDFSPYIIALSAIRIVAKQNKLEKFEECSNKEYKSDIIKCTFIINSLLSSQSEMSSKNDSNNRETLSRPSRNSSFSTIDSLA